MNTQDFSGRAFVAAVGLLFLAPVLNHLLENGLSRFAGRHVAFALVGVLLPVVAWFRWSWIELAVPPLGRFASDGRLWFGLFGVLWLYVVVDQGLRSWRSNAAIQLAEDSRNNAQSLQKILIDDMALIRLALQRFVLPRQLTAAQAETIVGYLKPYAPRLVTLVQPQHDNEASNFRADLQRAFSDARWTVTVKIRPRTEMTEGLHLNFVRASRDAQPPDPRSPSSELLIRGAFERANVDFNGGSSSGYAPDLAEDAVFVEVGPRRSDGYGQLSPFTTSSR